MIIQMSPLEEGIDCNLKNNAKRNERIGIMIS